MSVAQLRFIDNEDGTLKIEASHEGEFDADAHISHLALFRLSQLIPQLFENPTPAVQTEEHA